MRIKDLEVRKNSIVSPDGYILINLKPVADFEEIYQDIKENDLTELMDLFDDVTVHKFKSKLYISPTGKDIGVIYQGNGETPLKTRQALDNPEVTLCYIDEEDSIIVGTDDDYYYIISKVF